MSLGVHLKNNLGSELSGNGLTTAVWADCPVDSIKAGTVQGSIVEIPSVYQETATTVENAVGTPAFDTNATIKGVAAAGGGIAVFSTTDNEGAAIGFGGDTAAPFVIPADSSTGKKLWFECEVKKSLVGADLGGFFVGLAGEGAATVDFIADAGADIADVDCLGFLNLEAGATIDAITQKTGAAFDTIIDDMDTLVADTYVRLGFIYDPQCKKKQRIKFFVNGAQQTTYVGEDSGDATVYLGDTTNFPGGEEMAPMIALKDANAADLTVTLRRLRCVQLL